VRQLTIARSCGIGFVPCRLAGTGARRASTRPVTRTSRRPSERRSPSGSRSPPR
jgi:hypothetical protein